MKNKTKIITTSLMALTLGACGGGGSSSGGSDGVNTGVFLDSAVQGLTYKTETQLGTTDIDGKFKYKNGETVEFFLKNMKLGESAGANILYPINIVSRDEYEIPMAQLLQTLDFDNNLDNGIDVRQVHTEFTENINFEGMVNQSMINLMRNGEEVLETDVRYRELVSQESAEQHLRETEGSGSSSNGSDVKTGQFKDSAVKGLTYETLTQNGTTDEKGTFKYKAGETVTFKIGAMEIGSAEGADILYPVNIVGDDDDYKDKAIKIAQVLQTLDKDKNPDEGIDIKGQFKTESTKNHNIQDIDLQVLVDDIKKVDEPLTLVSASQAESHMDATIFSDARPTFESVSDQNGIDSRISVEKGRLKLNPQTSESVWLLAKNPINNITEITSLSADVEFVPNARVADLGLVLELKDQSSKAMYFRIAFMDSEGSACPPDAGGCVAVYVNRIVINSLYTGEFLSKEPLSVVKKNAPYIKETLEKDNELYYNSGWPSPPLSGSFKANFTIKFDRTAKKVVVKHGDKQSYFDASKLFSDFSQVQAKFFIKAQDLIHSNESVFNESVFVDNVKINNQDFDDFSATTLDTTKWKTGKFSMSADNMFNSRLDFAGSTLESISNQNNMSSRVSVDGGRLKLSPRNTDNVWLLAKNDTEITSLSADVEFVSEAEISALGLSIELNDDSLGGIERFRIFIAHLVGYCGTGALSCLGYYTDFITIKHWGSYAYTDGTLAGDIDLYESAQRLESAKYIPPSKNFKANFTVEFNRTTKKVIIKYGDKQGHFDVSSRFNDFSKVRAKFFIEAEGGYTTEKSVFVDNVKINNQDFDDFSAPTLDTTKWKTGKFYFSGGHY